MPDNENDSHLTLTCFLMQLTNFRIGTLVRITQLLPGSWGLRQRLLALGLLPGAIL